MRLDQNGSRNAAPDEAMLPHNYRTLNEQRLDIDRRIAGLMPNDPASDLLWLELEAMLAKLRGVISSLIDAPANDLPELWAKAGVLIHLLRPVAGESTLLIADDLKGALALSLADDVQRLTIA